ncbi:MAG TPA: glycerophosphodiester phosphodiesterase [Acidimicrobiales bacterium]|jgi:glycerophosphoryl diester phosphodiesterase|nr:glycerophosphodiester phosphodiesterase [Acidimicrobiales bacterium]
MTAVFAHRGATATYRENTLEAFAEAKRLGADGVELDVRLTADGALAVHHDPTIEGLGPLSELTVSSLPPHVPLLADALAVCDGLTVNVEIKNSPKDPGHDAGEAVAALTATAIDEAGWTDRVIVSSFEASTLRAVQVADPRLALGALWPFLADVDDYLALAVAEGWNAVHPFVTHVSASLVERAHAAELGVNVWTVNAAHDIEAFVALAVDAVITDNLAEAIAIARQEAR